PSVPLEGNETVGELGNESVEEEVEDDSVAPSVPLEGKEEVEIEEEETGEEDSGEDVVSEKKEKKDKESQGEEELEVIGITGKIVRDVGDAGLGVREWFVSGFENVVEEVRSWFG
ncbi:hypothetical protein KAJ38_03465, partial [Candidatus Pacearchaeota archaeon]|nr:hypothetical protein [Candidatus Pacearchaeota archaeon]